MPNHSFEPTPNGAAQFKRYGVMYMTTAAFEAGNGRN